MNGEKLNFSPREKLRTSKLEKRPIAVTKIKEPATTISDPKSRPIT